jgi:hypothetical protein
MPYAFISIGQSNMKRCEPYLETALKAAYGENTVLARCSKGGSNMWKDWQPGGSCFVATLLEIAVRQLQGYSIPAVLCNQGEADTLLQGAGANWATLYDNTVKALTIEIGGDVQFISSVLGAPPIGEMDKNGQPVNRPKWMEVFAAQRDYGDPEHQVRQWDIPRIPNDVHYAPDVYRDFHTPRYMAHLLRLVPVA